MTLKNLNDCLYPGTTILDAKSMDSHEKLKCEVCGSEDLTVGKYEINRGLTNYIKISVFCNNCENWGDVVINNLEQNEFYNDIIKGLEALEKEQEQLHADLEMKLKEALLINKKIRKEKV